MALAVGSNLDGYEVLGLLGAGGMGEVYRARDPILKREVAIKVLPAFVANDPERLARFEQEAQAAAALSHPNVVVVYRFGRFEGNPYIVSELLDGATLGHHLARGPLPLRKAIEYGTQIAKGLAAAHERGIIHRDLKPENVFVTKDGRVKILDFGLAKLTQSAAAAVADGQTVSAREQTNPGRVLGTVGYMSPEQVRGEAADYRSDIFATGAILYEMLTGTRAFRRATSAETMTAILREDPPSISQSAPNAPPVLLRVVHRCLEKNPEQRFQSASDLAFALDALSESSSSTVMIVDKRGRSRLTWLAGAAAALALVGLLVAVWRIPRALPIVETIVQLTDDGEPKQFGLATDGARVYFTEGPTGSVKIAQVSANGGRSAVIETQLGDMWIQGISPDRSSLLVEAGAFTDSLYSVWSIPVPAGEPRRLGDRAVANAAWFPDGRLLLIIGRDLLIADKDGSNITKLTSLAQSMYLPRISPDGKDILVTAEPAGKAALYDVAADGKSAPKLLGEGMCGASWSPDGKYIVYQTSLMRGSDMWAMPMTGWLQRDHTPIRLTTGALAYSDSLFSPDGKQIFTIGTKSRSELVHLDPATRQFLPLLSGISAISPSFSADGNWVAYTSYPDYTLWRSRADGSQRMQLTYPPLEVAYPFISNDGSKVAFGDSHGHVYVISMQGGTPQKVSDNAVSGLWSPDGNMLVLSSWKSVAGTGVWYLQLLDSRTMKTTSVPGSEGMVGGAWVNQNTIVAAAQSSTVFRTFDLTTQKWSDLLSGNFVNWLVTRDGKSMVFTTGGAEPTVARLRFSDRKVETLASLKGLRRVVDWVEFQTQVGVAPDGSPVFARDIGTQEIYALKMRWP